MRTSIFALMAVIPASVGPQPIASRSIETRLCGEGTITIPIPMRDPPEAPCSSKGCHGSNTRKRVDPAQ